MAILRGKIDQEGAKGDASHFQALSTAISGTVGTGNIGGGALAIYLGGPAALFWMWMTAFFGMTTKFVEVTLSHKYRVTDKAGFISGGPMYVIREGLPKSFHWLAYLFAIVGMIGCLPALQSNQLIQIFRDLVFIESGALSVGADPFVFNFIESSLRKLFQESLSLTNENLSLISASKT